jgi:hypothetical protein
VFLLIRRARHHQEERCGGTVRLGEALESFGDGSWLSDDHSTPKQGDVPRAEGRQKWTQSTGTALPHRHRMFAHQLSITAVTETT